jgi:hypothetical protein
MAYAEATAQAQSGPLTGAGDRPAR